MYSSLFLGAVAAGGVSGGWRVLVIFGVIATLMLLIVIAQRTDPDRGVRSGRSERSGRPLPPRLPARTDSGETEPGVEPR